MSLTEEFLKQIDPSFKLLKEFHKLKITKQISIISVDQRSQYVPGTIYFAFDGTTNTANTLIHEFMHHITEKVAQPSRDRESYSILSEFESIYYETAFNKFLQQKGIIPNGEENILATRSLKEFSKDPDDCLGTLLELCRKINNQPETSPDSIIEDFLHENENSKQSLVDFCKKHLFTREILSGPILYRFNTGLAMQCGYSIEDMQNFYKLAPLVKDNQNDHEFMQQFEILKNRTISQQIQPEQDEK